MSLTRIYRPLHGLKKIGSPFHPAERPHGVNLRSYRSHGPTDGEGVMSAFGRGTGE